MKKLLWLALSCLFACGGGDKKAPAPGLDAGMGGPSRRDGAVRPGDDDDDDDLPAAHTECLQVQEIDLVSIMKTPVPPASEGTSEVPLTADGCVRLSRTVQGGVLTALSIRRWSGFIGFDPGIFDGGIPDVTGIELSEIEYVYVDWKVAADGSLQVLFNLDGTDAPDARLVESYSGDRIARKEYTRFNRASDEVEQRRTLTTKDADTVHFKVERRKDGALTTVAEFDAPSRQRQNMPCYSQPPAGPSDTIACSEDFKKMVRDRVKSALDSSIACFSKYEDGWSIEQLRMYLFQQMHGDSLEVECFQSNEYVGEMDVGRKGPKLRINAEIFKCEQASFIDATLFHEVMHELRGPHDANDNELDGRLMGFGPRANAYTDSIRGCEELCFGTIKTACSCAACFETDTCDSRCSSLGSCIARDPMGNATMSEAVGALCRDPANVPADMKKSTWHATMMDCQSNCAFGAAQCKSYSLSCDDSCQ